MADYENDFEDYAETEFLDNLFNNSGGDPQDSADKEKETGRTNMENTGGQEAEQEVTASYEDEGLSSMTPIRKVLYINEQMNSRIERILKLVGQRDSQPDMNNLDEIRQYLNSLDKKLESIESRMEISADQHEGEQQGKKKNFLQTLCHKFRRNKKNAELIELLVTGFDEKQLEQIQLGLDEGLEINEVRDYAKKELSANAMEKIRKIYQKVKKETELDEQ